MKVAIQRLRLCGSSSTASKVLLRSRSATGRYHSILARSQSCINLLHARKTLRSSSWSRITPSRSFAWSVEKEPHALPSASEIVNPSVIENMIEETRSAARDPQRVREILSNAWDRALLKDVKAPRLPCGPAEPMSEHVQGLTLEEAAILLHIDPVEQRELMQDLCDTALKIKERIYGNRVVLFAPLYLSNLCVNSCTYCAFAGRNKSVKRNVLTDDQLVAEVEALQRLGHRRLLLLTGEHPGYSFDHFLRAVDLTANVTTEPHGRIRRINVEIPALSISDMRRLKATDQIGTYTLFQETYHPESFAKFHPGGPKSHYEHRLQTMDRAQIGGIDDVGIGALFGLHDYKFEVLAMLQHAQHLDDTYGAGPHTISIPRMRPADHAPTSVSPPHPVNDDDFTKLVAVLRCAVPYTGMILSTRESAAMRSRLLRLGISQMSAGSKTDVGSYHKDTAFLSRAGCGGIVGHNDQGDPAALEDPVVDQDLLAGQFSLLDHRPLDEVVRSLMESGFVPSWCTACYREGRTGEYFMSIAKKGKIHKFCHPNALLTLQEYIEDYASPEAKEHAEKVIAHERLQIGGSTTAVDHKLDRIRQGERDLYF